MGSPASPVAYRMTSAFSQAAFSKGRFWMVILAISLNDSFLLASRISIPTTCLFLSRSTVMPSSISILSSTSTSRNWMYKASASLSYSILNSDHPHPLFFFTAVMTNNSPFYSSYVTLRNLSDVFFQAFSRVSEKGSTKSGETWPIQPRLPIFDANAFCSLRVVYIAWLSFLKILSDTFVIFN